MEREQAESRRHLVRSVASTIVFVYRSTHVSFPESHLWFHQSAQFRRSVVENRFRSRNPRMTDSSTEYQMSRIPDAMLGRSLSLLIGLYFIILVRWLTLCRRKLSISKVSFIVILLPFVPYSSASLLRVPTPSTTPANWRETQKIGNPPKRVVC